MSSEPEDRVAAGIGSALDFASVIDDAMEGERFAIASTACSILAELIRGGLVLSVDQKASIESATIQDWTT